jgi:hypothetical protein
VQHKRHALEMIRRSELKQVSQLFTIRVTSQISLGTETPLYRMDRGRHTDRVGLNMKTEGGGHCFRQPTPHRTAAVLSIHDSAQAAAAMYRCKIHIDICNSVSFVQTRVLLPLLAIFF